MVIGHFEAHFMLAPQGFVGSEVSGAEHDFLVSVEIRQRLSNYPRPDREPVKDKIDWAMTFWAAAASALPDNPWRILSKVERKKIAKELL